MGRFPRRWPGRHRLGRCARRNAVSGWGRRPSRASAQEQPEPGPLRGPARTKPLGPALAEAPHPSPGGAPESTGARRSGVDAGEKSRDAKTEGGGKKASPLPRDAGRPAQLRNKSGGLAASRVPLRMVRWGTRRPIGQPSSGPALSGRGGRGAATGCLTGRGDGAARPESCPF